LPHGVRDVQAGGLHSRAKRGLGSRPPPLVPEKGSPSVARGSVFLTTRLLG
jgi:hypothetical protein